MNDLVWFLNKLNEKLQKLKHNLPCNLFCIAKKQVYRDNTEADNHETYYRRVLPSYYKIYQVITFYLKLLFLIPTVITKVSLDKDAYPQIIENVWEGSA